MSETMISTPTGDLCTETFGQSQNPPLLLIMGACASMLWWPREFCQMLADKGCFVIRYDNRDTGRSICYEPGTIHYTLDDMVEDARSVLDAYDIRSAHVMGASLGGMIAQLMALKYPDRLRTMTLLISGPVALAPDENLPPIEQKVLNHHANGGSIDWGNESVAVEFMTAGWAVTAGSRHPFDEPLIRETAQEEFHRSKCLLSMFNHALLTGGEWATGQLTRITTPTLIIHGTEDPVLPFPHAEFLARTIPGARLVALKGAGHEIHRNDWKEITQELRQQMAD